MSALRVLEKRLDATEARIEQRLMGAHSRWEALLTKLATIRARLDNIEARLDLSKERRAYNAF